MIVTRVKDAMDERLSQATLHEQIVNPQHVYVLINGTPVSHGTGSDPAIEPRDPYKKGDPIRFTMLAAKHYVERWWVKAMGLAELVTPEQWEEREMKRQWEEAQRLSSEAPKKAYKYDRRCKSEQRNS